MKDHKRLLHDLFNGNLLMAKESIVTFRFIVPSQAEDLQSLNRIGYLMGFSHLAIMFEMPGNKPNDFLYCLLCFKMIQPMKLVHRIEI